MVKEGSKIDPDSSRLQYFVYELDITISVKQKHIKKFMIRISTNSLLISINQYFGSLLNDNRRCIDEKTSNHGVETRVEGLILAVYVHQVSRCHAEYRKV